MTMTVGSHDQISVQCRITFVQRDHETSSHDCETCGQVVKAFNWD